MEFDILTLFPEMFDILNTSIIGRGVKNGLLKINVTNIRDFSKEKHKHVDDTPYGGGAGMIMKPDVVYDAYESIIKRIESENVNEKQIKKPKVIYMTPKGNILTQKKVKELSKEKHLIILCGHYEGIDERVLEDIVDEEISIGDYVLTGGELPCMCLIDSVSRYVDGVLSEESTVEESFSNENNLLEYPQYTRPVEFRGKKVPEVLISGNHQEIDKWRKEQSLITTYKKRKELLSKEQQKEAEKLIKHSNE